MTEKPGRIVSGGLTTRIFTLKLMASDPCVSERRSGSFFAIGEDPTSVTIPSNGRLGYASMFRLAFCPIFTSGTEVSSTIITASTSDMSETVSSCVPGLFIVPMTVTSPSLTGRYVITPAIGALTVVLESESRLAARFAPDSSRRCWIAERFACAVSYADFVFWYSASERIFASQLRFARS